MSLPAGDSTGRGTGNPAGKSAGNLSGDTTGPGWMRRLWTYIDRHRRELYLSLTGAVIGGACQVVIPLAERQIVDGVVVSQTSALWPWLLLMALLSLVGFAMAYVRRYSGGRVALGVQFDLRNAMHDHLQRMDLRPWTRMPTGQLVGRANSDSTLVQGLLNFFPIMSGNVLLVIGSLAVMLWLSPLLAVVSLVVVPVVTVLSYRMRSKVFPATWDAQQREGDVVQIVDEDVNGVRVVKAFGQEQRELRRVADASKALYGSAGAAGPAAGALPAAPRGHAGPRPGRGPGPRRLDGPAPPDHPGHVPGLLHLHGPAGRARPAPGRRPHRGSAGPGRRGADLPAAGPAPGHRGPSRRRGAAAAAAARSLLRRPLRLQRGRAGPERLQPDRRAGERVALVGPSGSGKSTAMLLLSRFYDPQSGAVLVDGHDVRDVTLASLRRQVGVVFEESFLFSDSVRANIAYGRPDATDDEIEAAARAAGAHEFIEELPRGYDTWSGNAA